MKTPDTEWQEEIKNGTALGVPGSERVTVSSDWLAHLLSSRDTYWKERQTFLGDLFGVPIFAETREEVKLQAINKWLEEARMKMMELTPITNEDNLK